MQIVEHGLYLVKDIYFQTFPSPGWMWNKGENRPHYFSFRDTHGLLWLVTMSSKTEKYRDKIKREEEKRGIGNCIYYHIGRISGQDRAFIISGLFPVTEEYISRSYNMNQAPYIVQDKILIRQIRSKAMRYIRLLEQKKLRDQNNILSIRCKLKK